MEKKTLCGPIMALFLLSLGGLLLHLRIHPPTNSAENWVPAIFGIVTAVLVPVLFYFRPTMPVAYLINWAAVIVGTITMAHFSIEHMPEGQAVTWKFLILQTTLADILILWAKIPLGQTIFRHFRPKKASLDTDTDEA